MLGSERGYAFIERIEALRGVLPERAYTNGIGMGRAPMPVYSNETNCSNCHIGAIPGAFGQDLSDPYPGAQKWTAKPAPPSFLGTDTVDCD